MANRIQLRRGGAQEWANSNPTLAQGELGVELDTGRFKIGDGVTAWNSLRYERPIESTSNTANTLVQRDADGNFQAGTVTATVIGNASTSSRLSSTRQIQLTDDVTCSGVFDGSANLTLNATLELLSSLPHYDGTSTSTGSYTKVTVDAKGRIINASTPSTLADYNLNGTVEGSSAQAYDADLASFASLSSNGLVSRVSNGSITTRVLTGTASRISVSDGGGLLGNPIIDMILTAVVPGDYNTESLTSVNGVGSNSEPFGTQTVNATKFTVDGYGRLTSSTNVPIATAVEGTDAAAYNNGSTYSRGDRITNASNLYQAILAISSGAGAPTHTDTSDTGSWRHLGAVTTKQKGLASFAQEDFDVSAGGHVSLSTAGIDNDQLQNSRISFADGNAKEDFDLDQELTTTTGYRGFNYLNYVKVNDTSGNLLFGANNTGDAGAGEVDINVRTYISDPDITLDGAVAQTLDKSGDGNLTFQTTQNSTSARSLSILATNAGSGASNIVVTAEDKVTITASEATNGKVQVEDTYFQGDYIASSAATMILDPGDDRAVTGKVQILGDLQVDGTTTTVNSTVTTVDDPIFTLGGDTAPGSDDNKDRGIEFRYYDAAAKVGFFGYDDSAADLGGHTGAFTFLYDATNTSEVFAGTDAGIIAGNLSLTTNTNSTSNTTGDLVVAGGVGIGDDVNIGGLLDVDGTFRANSTSRFDDNIVFQGASKTLQLNNGSGTTKTTLHTTTGNAEFGGIVTTTGAIDANSSLNVAGLVYLESTDAPDILSGAPHSIQNADYGAFRCDGGGYFDKAVLFNGDIFLNGDFNQQEDATENYGLRNYLSIRYKMRAGSVAAYTPSYSNHNTSNLRVFGGAGVNTTLHIGATGSGEGLFVGKKNSGDTVKFSVDGPSGNVDTAGTLVVAGQTTINDSVYINAANEEFAIQNGSASDKFTVDTDNGNTLIEGTLNVNGVTDIDADFAVRNNTTDKFKVTASNGNTNIEGTLTADGHTELNSTLNVDNNTTLGGTLVVTSTSEFNGTVDVDANFAVRSGTTDKFTVASSSGNTATDGTLVVQGQTTINDSLIVDAANEEFAIQNGSGTDKFTVDTDNGNTDITGTLTVGSTTQINNTFGSTGVSSFTNASDQTLAGSYAADGAVRLSGGIGTAKNLAVGGGARVHGNTELTGSLDLNNDADISGNLVVSNTDEATSLGDASVALQVAGGATIDKNAYVGGNFVVYDAGNTRAAFTVTNASGDAALYNDLTIGGNLVVNGSTTTVNSTVTTLDDPIITLGGDTAPASNDGKDRGVEFRYYDGSAKIGFFGYDRSSSQYVFLTDSTNTGEVHSGTDAGIKAGSLNLTAAGTALDVDNNANIDGTLTVDGQITSNLATGTAPLSIASTTKVSNLNVDLLDGMTTASANTNSTVVNRDGSGNFAAGTITAALTGNASTATTLETARTITVDGVVDGNVSFNGSADVTITTTYADADITALAAMSGTGFVVRTAANTYAQRTISATASSGVTITNGDGVAGNTTINVLSAATNAANNLVLRDASGDFAANIITAALVGNVTGNLTGDVTGNADTATALATARNIGGVSFDGSASINLPGVNAGGNQDTSGNAATATALATARTIGGTSFDGTVDITPGSATQAANLNNHDTADLSEGTNLYYTEARVQAKLDNAYEQLRSMLNNLATATTLTLNLSADPTPGDVTVLNSGSLSGGTGYVSATAVATTGGSGTGLTVDITAVAGAVTAVTINAAGGNYVEGETITISGGGANATIAILTVKEMEVGQTLTGATSGTTGVITALGSTSVTVDNVDGFFKKTEVVAAGNVNNLTVSSFA